MSDVEVHVSLEIEEEGRFMARSQILFFWQGIQSEQPGFDLDYYIRELPQPLCQVLLRHRFLRVGVSFLRKANPWMMLTFLTVNSLIIHPVAIFLHLSDAETIVDNAYPMFIWIFIVVAMAGTFLQRDTLHSLFCEFDKFIHEFKLDNDEQKELLKKSVIFCNHINFLCYLFALPVGFAFFLIYSIIWCLPYRKLYFSGWYPYNETTWPAYEITLAINSIETMTIVSASNILIASVVTFFINVVVVFKIIANKFENIRITSINSIKARKIREMELRSQTLGTGLFGLNESASVEEGLPGLVASQGFPPIDGPRGLGLPPIPHSNRVNVQGTTIDRDNIKITREEVDLEMRAQMVITLCFHQTLLGIVNRFSDFISFLFLDMFAINVIIYGGTLLLFIKVKTLTIKIYTLVCVSMEVVILYLVLNILANMISDESAAVVEALYASDWLEASPSFKRDMLIAMTRANTPVEFKAPGVDPLSVKNFGEVAKIAYKTAQTLTAFK